VAHPGLALGLNQVVVVELLEDKGEAEAKMQTPQQPDLPGKLFSTTTSNFEQ
jgi:hypothetical protein